MLQVSQIIENKENFISGLKKRNFKDAENHLDRVTTLDRTRRETQADLDRLLSESNKKSKEIGLFMKEGKKDDAENAKALSADLKAKSKERQQELSEIEDELNKLLLILVLSKFKSFNASKISSRW